MFGNGRVNANTAKREVLEAILRTGAPSIASPDKVAAQIIDHRRDGREKDIDNDMAFRTLEDLALVSAVGDAARGLIRFLDIKSFTFRIVSTGDVAGTLRTIETVVDRHWEVFDPTEVIVPDIEEITGREPRDSDDIVFDPSVRALQWMEN